MRTQKYTLRQMISIDANQILKRIGLLSICLGIQLLYFPLNRHQSGGFVPVLGWDEFIPLLPLWAIPYLLAIPYWIMMYAWACFFMKTDLFMSCVKVSAIVFLIGQLSFFLFPTYVIRPTINNDGWEYMFLKWIYQNDQVHNALPSGHAYISTIIFLFWRKWLPKYSWLWAGILIIILLSTLFTGQHYILDIIAGCLLSLIIYWAVMKVP